MDVQRIARIGPSDRTSPASRNTNSGNRRSKPDAIPEAEPLLKTEQSLIHDEEFCALDPQVRVILAQLDLELYPQIAQMIKVVLAA